MTFFYGSGNTHIHHSSNNAMITNVPIKQIPGIRRKKKEIYIENQPKPNNIKYITSKREKPKHYTTWVYKVGEREREGSGWRKQKKNV